MEFRGKREGKRDGGQNRMLKENGIEEEENVEEINLKEKKWNIKEMR